MQNIILLIGTMVGAGFASGKEISLFFLSSGQYAILGLFVSALLTTLILYKVIQIVQVRHIQNYQELIDYILPKKIPYLGQILGQIINLFLLVSFYIMIAGFATYFKQEVPLPMIIGILLILMITYIACKGNIQAIKKMNNIVIPILILVIIHIWFQNVDNQVLETMVTQETEAGCIQACIRAILYSSYNSILLIPIVIEVAKTITSKEKAKMTAIGTGIGVFLLGYFLCTLLFQGATTSILKKDLPLLEVIKMIEPNFQKIYGIMIAIAIITSAIATVYGYLKNVTTTEKNYQKWLRILCITAVPISYIGFSNLINSIYPVFGIIGTIQILLLYTKK